MLSLPSAESRGDADLPRHVQMVGLTIVALFLLSFVALRGISVRHLLSTDLLVGAATTWPFVAVMVYGARRLERSDFPPEHYGRIRSWFVGGLVGFLGLNLVMIAVWPAETLYNNVAWALFAAAVGGTAGFGIGFFEAQQIRQVVRTERQRRRREEAEAQNQRLMDFAESVAHDLRNPLNVAVGSLELARREPKEEHFENVEVAHERMATLIDRSLQLARSGREIAETESVELSAFARQCWSNVATGNAELEVRRSATVEADPDRLSQLLENLFRNSVEHGSEPNSEASFYRGAASRSPNDETEGSGSETGDDRDDAEVTVVVGPLSDAAGFYVADDGPGISESDRSKVLESGVSSREGGSGLGLSIVQRIATAHGWTVDVGESDAGGARFEFRVGSDE